jgi:hypothetical protein
MVRVAAERDRIGTLSLLVAPSLIVAPYERLQTYARRRNAQADYLRFPDAHKRFNPVMQTPFAKADFWPSDETSRQGWQSAPLPALAQDPGRWRTKEGCHPWEDAFWNIQIGEHETRWVWKLLRDALSHWNVVNCDRGHRLFDEGGVMERLLFYRAHDDRGPWDIVSVSPDGFLTFLECWSAFLAGGAAREVLLASEAA